jgi:hypothetical protein
MAFTMAGAQFAPKYRTNRAAKTAKKSVAPTIPAGFDQVYKDLLAYNGNFHVIVSIRSALMRYGRLTDKQWQTVQKCLAPKPQIDPSAILVDKCDIPITISPSAARNIGLHHNWPINPCTLRVTQIKTVSGSVYTLRVKIDWSGNVSVCRCCGRTLTDWRSQATGVGPFCVKRTSIQYVRNQADVTRFQQEMEQLCKQLGEVEITINKWMFRLGLNYVRDAVNDALKTKPVTMVYKPQPPAPPKPAPVPVLLLSDCIWNEQFRTLVTKVNVDPQAELVKVYNPITQVAVMFQRWPNDGSRYRNVDGPTEKIDLFIQK